VTPAVPGDTDAGSPVLSAGKYDSFVVRVFSRSAAGDLVHGEVTHVASRRKRRFTDLSIALAFMAAQMATQVPGPSAVEHD
jgi:hypothetical protein